MTINGYLSAITVCCDRCGNANTRDYLVTDACDQTARRSYARAYLRTIGWLCDRRGDFCPLHVPAVAW